MSLKGEQTRQLIVDKSLKLFAMRGFSATSIDDIAQATQLTKGGIYGHFKSKDEIWLAAYKECSKLWRDTVFTGIESIKDPLERIEKVIENALNNYIGSPKYKGGCLLVTALVEFAWCSSGMRQRVLKGFTAFSTVINKWLEEANEKGMLVENLNLAGVSSFIVASISGTGPLYTASRNPEIWKQSIVQLKFFIRHLRKNT